MGGASWSSIGSIGFFFKFLIRLRLRVRCLPLRREGSALRRRSAAECVVQRYRLARGEGGAPLRQAPGSQAPLQSVREHSGGEAERVVGVGCRDLAQAVMADVFRVAIRSGVPRGAWSCRGNRPTRRRLPTASHASPQRGSSRRRLSLCSDNRPGSPRPPTMTPRSRARQRPPAKIRERVPQLRHSRKPIPSGPERFPSG